MWNSVLDYYIKCVITQGVDTTRRLRTNGNRQSLYYTYESNLIHIMVFLSS